MTKLHQIQGKDRFYGNSGGERDSEGELTLGGWAVGLAKRIPGEDEEGGIARQLFRREVLKKRNAPAVRLQFKASVAPHFLFGDIENLFCTWAESCHSDDDCPAKRLPLEMLPGLVFSELTCEHAKPGSSEADRCRGGKPDQIAGPIEQSRRAVARAGDHLVCAGKAFAGIHLFTRCTFFLQRKRWCGEA